MTAVPGPHPSPAHTPGGRDPFLAIDADLELLAELDPAAQLPVFGRIHSALTATLAATAGSADNQPMGR